MIQILRALNSFSHGSLSGVQSIALCSALPYTLNRALGSARGQGSARGGAATSTIDLIVGGTSGVPKVGSASGTPAIVRITSPPSTVTPNEQY